MSIENKENNALSKISNSVTMDLENLSMQYSNLLIQYEQAVADYSNLLSNSINGNVDASMIVVPGQAYWGTTPISSVSGSSILKCKALCSSTPKCTGATYNTETQTCWIRGGAGSTIPSSQSSYALINEEQFLMSQIQSINEELINVNNQILEQINVAQPLFNVEYKIRQNNAEALLNNYFNLLQEKERIDKTIQEYEYLDQQHVQSNVTTNANYYSFIMLLLLSIALVIFVGTHLQSGTNANANAMPVSSFASSNPEGNELGKNVYIIIFVIILITVFISNYTDILLLITSTIQIAKNKWSSLMVKLSNVF